MWLKERQRILLANIAASGNATEDNDFCEGIENAEYIGIYEGIYEFYLFY